MLVGKPVEAVAAQTFRLVGSRQREAGGDGRHRVMKRGVEADCLRQARACGRNGADRREILWLVERRQRYEAVQRIEKFRRHELWPYMVASAVHDPVPHGQQAVLAEMGFGPVENPVQKQPEVAGGLRPAFVRQNGAR